MHIYIVYIEIYMYNIEICHIVHRFGSTQYHYVIVLILIKIEKCKI